MFKPLWILHPLRTKYDEAQAKVTKFLEKVLSTYRNARMTDNHNKVATTPGIEVGTKSRKCLMEELLDSRMSDQEILNELDTIAVAVSFNNDLSAILRYFQQKKRFIFWTYVKCNDLCTWLITYRVMIHQVSL